MNKIRVTVDFSEELYKDLEILEKRLGLSKAALLRKAIKLEKLLFDAKVEGNIILLQNISTHKIREVILM